MFLPIIRLGVICLCIIAASNHTGYGINSVSADSLISDVSTERFFKKHISILAGDSLQGRGTGQEGSKRTADYLYKYYSTPLFSSLPNAQLIRQTFELEGLFWEQVTFSVYEETSSGLTQQSESTLFYKTIADFYPVSGGSEPLKGPVFFAGYDYDTVMYDDIDHENDHWVMVFCDISANSDHASLKEIRSISRNHGVLGVLCIENYTMQQWENSSLYYSKQLNRPLSVRMDSGAFRSSQYVDGTILSIRPDMAAGILGFSHQEKLDSLRENWTHHDHSDWVHQTRFWLENNPGLEKRSFHEDNLIWVINGSDDSTNDEIVVLSAHYDHLGIGSADDFSNIIYYGADDNASGTSVLMNTAKLFAKLDNMGQAPERTIVFLHTAAEEWGLFGSRHFVTSNLYDTEKIIANLNVDMIGFVDATYEESHETDYVYVIGAGLMSTSLEHMLETVNNHSVDLILDYSFNTTTDFHQLYRRSDQWAFGERQIPFVFFFSGLHDYYHTPLDTYDRISFDALIKRTELFFRLALKLTKAEQIPTWDRNIFRLPD